MTDRLPPPGSVELRKQGHITLHLVPAGVWAQQRERPFYRPERFEDDEFIHCTDSVEEVIAVGNRYYRADQRAYVLLEIDCARVAAPIVYEDPAQIFPHIYGELEPSAVIRILPVERAHDGEFVAIGEPNTP